MMTSAFESTGEKLKVAIKIQIIMELLFKGSKNKDSKLFISVDKIS